MLSLSKPTEIDFDLLQNIFRALLNDISGVFKVWVLVSYFPAKSQES